jgi:hypothetical protein
MANLIKDTLGTKNESLLFRKEVAFSRNYSLKGKNSVSFEYTYLITFHVAKNRNKTPTQK